VHRYNIKHTELRRESKIHAKKNEVKHIEFRRESKRDMYRNNIKI
jgi:hypothetical protein